MPDGSLTATEQRGFNAQDKSTRFSESRRWRGSRRGITVATCNLQRSWPGTFPEDQKSEWIVTLRNDEEIRIVNPGYHITTDNLPELIEQAGFTVLKELTLENEPFYTSLANHPDQLPYEEFSGHLFHEVESDPVGLSSTDVGCF